MNKNNNIPGPFSNLPIFAEATEDDEEIMLPLSIEDEMRIFYENKYKREYERKLKEYQQVFEQAKKQGLVQGLSAGRREIARVMRNDGEPVEKIIKYTGLSGEEIQQL